MSKIAEKEKEFMEVWNDAENFPTRQSIADHFGVKIGAIKSRALRARKKGISLIDRTLSTGDISNAPLPSRDGLTRNNQIKRYVVTCAQNNTQLNDRFWRSLKHYCAANDAELLVTKIRYMTKSVYDRDPEWFPNKVIPHLLDEDLEIHPNCVIMGGTHVHATKVNPCEGFEGMNGRKWQIIGHPQIQMRVTPTPQDVLPKITQSTGSVSEKNYRPGTAGKKGEFHHTFGAAVIECQGDTVHLRQINADQDGKFFDVAGHTMKEYTPTGVKHADRIEALITGDEHEMFYSPRVKAATYGPVGMVEELRPKYLVRHDVLDFWSRNHHHENDPIIAFAKHHGGTASVEKELLACIKHLDSTTPEWLEANCIVASNHPEALLKWLKRAQPHKDDPENALIYHELWTVLLKAARMGKTGVESIDPFQYYVEKHAEKEHQFVGRDQEFLIKGIDCGQHGDAGANGARGSARSFAKAANRMVIGHSHTPCIDKGVYQVGHSTDGMNYTRGHSGWVNTHALIYPNGKRTLIHILPNGRWRAG